MFFLFSVNILLFVKIAIWSEPIPFISPEIIELGGWSKYLTVAGLTPIGMVFLSEKYNSMLLLNFSADLVAVVSIVKSIKVIDRKVEMMMVCFLYFFDDIKGNNEHPTIDSIPSGNMLIDVNKAMKP